MNVDESPIYPAGLGFDNTISVAASNNDLGMMYFSNYGMKNVDISAWGRDVESAFPDGGYGTLNGTSVSATRVSGAAALVAASGHEDNLKNTLKNSADKLSRLDKKVDGGNKISFADAVNGVIEKVMGTIIPEDDFDVNGYQPTPEEN